MSYFVVSYVPLLYNDSGAVLQEGDIYINLEELTEKMENAPVNISACLWVQMSAGENEEPALILVLDEAQAIYDHMLYWAEGKPEEWFDIFLGPEDDGGVQGYGVRVHPRIEKTVNRFRINMLSAHESIVKKDDIQVIYCPLSFWSGNTSGYDIVKDRLKDDIEVFMLDSALVRGRDNQLELMLAHGVLEEKTLRIGRLAIKDEGRWSHRLPTESPV